MKKISMVALGAILFVGAANAGFQQSGANNKTVHGGFVGGTDKITTTDHIKDLRDDTPVVMTGKIVKKTGDEKYLFQDGAGTITVEIEDDDWHGVNVTPDDNVKLHGEVDRGIFNTVVEIDSIELMNQE